MSKGLEIQKVSCLLMPLLSLSFLFCRLFLFWASNRFPWKFQNILWQKICMMSFSTLKTFASLKSNFNFFLGRVMKKFRSLQKLTTFQISRLWNLYLSKSFSRHLMHCQLTRPTLVSQIKTNKIYVLLIFLRWGLKM